MNIITFGTLPLVLIANSKCQENCMRASLIGKARKMWTWKARVARRYTRHCLAPWGAHQPSPWPAWEMLRYTHAQSNRTQAVRLLEHTRQQPRRMATLAFQFPLPALLHAISMYVLRGVSPVRLHLERLTRPTRNAVPGARRRPSTTASSARVAGSPLATLPLVSHADTAKGSRARSHLRAVQ